MFSDPVVEELVQGPGGIALAFLLGTLWGSFANVCIYRMPPTEGHPEGQSVATPASHCCVCGASIRWYDNIPLLSYLWLRGRCRACKTSFSPRYVLVEFLTGAGFVGALVLSGAQYPGSPVAMQLGVFATYAALVFVLVVIAFIDLDHKLILNRVTYPAIVVFYGLGVVCLRQSWEVGLIGAAVGYGAIRLVSDGYYYLTGREGMGYGDGKLLAIAGALFGWKAVVLALFGGSTVGSIITLSALGIQRIRGGKAELGEDGEPKSIRHVEIPFGPFLTVGIVAYPILLAFFEAALFPL